MKHAIVAFLATLLLATGGAFALTANASTGEGSEPNCEDEFLTEVIHHDAVYETVHHPAVPAGPDLWWNWSPNKHQGPFDGPPAFPTDPRGTWQGPHENGGPSQDTYGTFQQGNGHGSWFHREHGTPGEDAWDEQVLVTPAWDEEVQVPNPDYPCETETPTDPPTDPTDPPTTDEPTDPTDPPTTDEPTEPTDPPTTDEPEPTDPPETDEPGTSSHSVQCVGDALVIKNTDEDGNSSTRTINGHPRCAVGTEEGPSEPVLEEGF